MQEKATESEYVWIEVPRTEQVYPTAGTNIKNFTDEEYTKIETDLHTYTKDYKAGTTSSDYSDVYSADSTTGWFTETGDTSYDKAKKKMLKSVYQNGGFWIGRYEAGIEKNRTASGAAKTTPLSKANLYPYTYVTRTQAKVLAEQVESGSYTSSLMFGVQWNLVMKYLETKGATTQANLNRKSSAIGNYFDVKRTLIRGKYASINDLTNWYDYNKNLADCVQNGKTMGKMPVLFTTGASDETKLNNIYDIAGNAFEWILEKATDKQGTCTYAGGGFVSPSSAAAASSHYGYSNSHCDNSVGFRISIY